MLVSSSLLSLRIPFGYFLVFIYNLFEIVTKLFKYDFFQNLVCVAPNQSAYGWWLLCRYAFLLSVVPHILCNALYRTLKKRTVAKSFRISHTFSFPFCNCFIRSCNLLICISYCFILSCATKQESYLPT